MLSREKKHFMAVLIIISLAFFLLFLGKNVLFKTSLEKAIKNITGTRLLIEEFNLGIIKTNLEIKELLLLNPKHFSDRIMFDVLHLYVDYDLPALLKGKLYFMV